MSYFEFPHTRIYDADLGWLIKHVKANLDNIADLETWKATHEAEYKELAHDVEQLIKSLVDVITPWTAEAAYNIFTVVSYDGQNYIALQDVPLGIMITNTDYWQPVNTVTEQINAMAAIVSKLDSRSRSDLTAAVAGYYIGDFITWKGLPSAVTKVGDYIYTLTAYDDSSNNAALNVFSIEGNNKVSGFPAEIYAGHANSITYDPAAEKFYICPVFYYQAGSTEPLRPYEVLEYNADFSSYRTIETEKRYYGCDYDHKTGKLYFLSYTGEIDLLSNGIFTTIDNISSAIAGSKIAYNQDFAVYDGAWFVSDPSGMIVSGQIGGKDYNYSNMLHMDAESRYYLGELEGWSATENGDILAIVYTSLVDTQKDAFILNIPFKNPMEKMTKNYSRGNFTLTLSEASQAAFNNVTALKSLNQLLLLTEQPTTVTINGAVEGGRVRIKNSVRLNITGTYEVGRIFVHAGIVLVQGAGSIEFINTDGSLFQIEEGAVTIRMRGSLSITTPNISGNAISLVYSGNSMGEAIIGDLYTFDKTNITVNGLAYRRGHYIGGRWNPIETQAGSQTVQIDQGSNYTDVTVTFNQAFTTDPYVMLSVYTSTANRNNMGVAAITSVSRSQFTARIWRLGEDSTGDYSRPNLRWLAFGA